jgi:hypothetical protein
MLRPDTPTAAVLLGAMVSFSAPPDVDLTGKRVRVANGQRDLMATAAHTTALISQLHARGAKAADLLPTPGTRWIRATCRASASSCKRCTPTTADPLPIACSCSAG